MAKQRRCKRCGKALSKETYRHCPDCGADAPRAKRCPKCGLRMVSESYYYCRGCGAVY